MTQHLHTEFDPYCYRCELSRDEADHAARETVLEFPHPEDCDWTLGLGEECSCGLDDALLAMYQAGRADDRGLDLTRAFRGLIGARLSADAGSQAREASAWDATYLACEALEHALRATS